MKRILAAVAVTAATVVSTAGVAEAAVPSASQMDCNNAASLTATAQVNATNTLNILVARAKELGFTSQQITDAQRVIADAKTVVAAQSGLMMVYSEHPVTGFATADLKLVGNAVTARLNLAAAQAAQNVSCFGFTPGAPAANSAGGTTTTTTTTTTGLAPGAVVAPSMPTGAPATGDGTVYGK